MKERVKKALIHLNKNIFQYLLIFYLVILLVQEYNENFLKFLNMSYMLILTIVLGVITVLTYKPKQIEKQKLTSLDNYFIYFLGVTGAVLVYFKINDLGWISYLISALSGILIIVLNKLIVEEDENNFEAEEEA